jgi:hypothetical protein
MQSVLKREGFCMKSSHGFKNKILIPSLPVILLSHSLNFCRSERFTDCSHLAFIPQGKQEVLEFVGLEEVLDALLSSYRFVFVSTHI